ncbi:MAG: hypothetical protein H6733_14120 [Alphaproteobacteria bacterium]|nr:hypothetical protein [Alphaproteobacteria bacterium]
MRILSCLTVVALVGCARPVPPAPLADLTIPALPLWTNKYATTPAEQGVFFEISTLMDRYGLSRLAAVELQNQVRDQLRADPTADLQAAFDTALASVEAGHFESGLDPAALAAKRFVVVFDLDETLYDQYYPAALAEGCHDVAYTDSGTAHAFKLTPGWDAAFATVRALGGGIVLFSANVDALTLGNVAHWTWEGRSLLDHPDILGVLTNSHLVLQDKAEPPKPAPVVEPSKDLRIVDPSLQRVIIVDDNPTRLFQLANTRLVRKFHADHWCDPGVEPAFQAALGGELVAFDAELRDSVAWWDAHPDATFQQAFAPYTMLGRVAVDALAGANGWTREAAIGWLRDHPDAMDARF